MSRTPARPWVDVRYELDVPAGPFSSLCGRLLCAAGERHAAQHQGDAPSTVMVMVTQLGPGWLDHLKARRAEGHDLVDRWSGHLRTAPETGLA